MMKSKARTAVNLLALSFSLSFSSIGEIKYCINLKIPAPISPIMPAIRNKAKSPLTSEKANLTV